MAGRTPRPSTGPRFPGSPPTALCVRAEYLLAGYSTGASVGDDAKALVRRLEAFEEENAAFLLGPTGPILFLNGTDHQEPQPWLGRVVAEANAVQSRFEISITSLEEALAGAPAQGFPSGRASCARAPGRTC